MALKYILAGCSAAILAVTPVKAAHPSLLECGGAKLNKNEGVRKRSIISRSAEQKIEQFLVLSDALPGASIAIVKGDEIVYARGYGFRDLNGCKKAASDTRYYLKSTTKNFTGAAAAILHEEGVIELDAPIGEYLPDLKLPDGLNTSQISIRAHLTHTQPYHNAGLNYRTAFPGNLPEGEFVAHMNEFATSKDSRFRYSNVGPIMAAHAIGTKTGVNWRDFIHEKVFAPAGMKNSFTLIAEAEKGPMAQGYVGAIDQNFTSSITKSDKQMHAAGGAVSTAADLGRWLVLNLNEGKIDGEQALPKIAIKQMQARQVQMDLNFLGIKRFAYGLGVYSATYDGDLLMHHFGGETHMSYMPDHDLGIVVLTNELDFGGRVTHALALSIYDILLEKPDVEERINERVAKIASAKEDLSGRLAKYLENVSNQAPEKAPVFKADQLIGVYENARLGRMVIRKEGDIPQLTYGVIEAPLEHIGGDAYLVQVGLWNSIPPQVMSFRTDEKFGFVLAWGDRIFIRTN